MRLRGSLTITSSCTASPNPAAASEPAAAHQLFARHPRHYTMRVQMPLPTNLGRAAASGDTPSRGDSSFGSVIAEQRAPSLTDSKRRTAAGDVARHGSR